MKWIVLSLTLLALVACDSEPKKTPTTPPPVVKPTPPATPATPAADAGKTPVAAPDSAPAPPAAPAADAGGPDEAAKAPGLLPSPDFKLKGPDFKAPSSNPAEDSDKPKLIDLDLKKE
jgi:hypothetical protein